MRQSGTFERESIDVAEADVLLMACVRLAAERANAPMAAFSILESGSDLLAATVGFTSASPRLWPDGPAGRWQRDVATPQTLVVSDMAAGTVAIAPTARAYLAVPVIEDGACVGALCVFDEVPRAFPASLVDELRLITVPLGLRHELLSDEPPAPSRVRSGDDAPHQLRELSGQIDLIERALLGVPGAAQLATLVGDGPSSADFHRTMVVLVEVATFYQDLTRVVRRLRSDIAALRAALER